MLRIVDNIITRNKKAVEIAKNVLDLVPLSVLCSINNDEKNNIVAVKVILSNKSDDMCFVIIYIFLLKAS